MTERIDFQAVHQTAMLQIDHFLESSLPGGKREGHEYVVRNPTRPDNSPGSFKINMLRGTWSDFATGDAGGDLVSLYAYLNGIEQLDAATALHAAYGGPGFANRSSTKPKPTRSAPARTTWTPLLPVPDDAPEPPKAHYKFGAYGRKWAYLDRDGRLMGYTCRFDRTNSTGERVKDILPLTWCVNESGIAEWRFRSFEPPRPLYGLERLGNPPERPVLIVEGEKCADAGQAVLSGMTVVSWIGGSKGCARVDWTPLKGREVMLWPDNDEPGISAMRMIVEKLKPVVKRLAMLMPGVDKPKGWDIADAIEEGWTAETIGTFLETALPIDTESAVMVTGDLFDAAPFRCLGYDHGNYYYLSERGQQVIELPSNQHTSKNLVSLAPLQWWWDNFPGEKAPSWQNAVDALFTRCYRAGIYDHSRKRGRGAWFDEKRVVLHHGSHLVVNGRRCTLTDLDTTNIYEAGPPTEITGADPISAESARFLMSAMELVAWEKPVSALLLAGWCVVAPISGALQWRPHILITGPVGSGKSTIVDNIVRRILGPASLYVLSNTTEAGIRQSLGNDAFPVIFDEAEGEDQYAQRRMDHVLELIRQASSDTGAAILKGSQGGKAIQFKIRSCFCLASVGVNIRQRSDASRISVLGLTRHHPKDRQDIFDEFKEHIASFTREWAAGFRARSVRMIPVIRENAAIFSRVVAAQFNGDQRMGDQIGTMLAGAWCIGHDTVVEYTDAVTFVSQQDWSEQELVDIDSDEERCLSEILQYTLAVNQDGRRLERSVVKLLQIAADIKSYEDKEVTETDANATLARNGIRYHRETGQIVISNSHNGIRRMMQETPWSRGWNRILRRIDGASDISAFRFEYGIRTRAVGIPLDHVFEEEEACRNC